jgi:hypothetical protein
MSLGKLGERACHWQRLKVSAKSLENRPTAWGYVADGAHKGVLARLPRCRPRNRNVTALERGPRNHIAAKRRDTTTMRHDLPASRSMAPRLLAATVPLLMTLLPTWSAAQADGDPVTLGAYRVLRSEILAEDRVLQVHLPTWYASGNRSYPVVFVFYSDWVEGYFAQLVNDLYHLSMDHIPPMILVGVANTQRYRDLLPWPRPGGQPGDGQADRFLRFVREELIPFIDREYRTKQYRIMVGPQAAGIFGIYALLESPGTFNAFILNDPCLADHPERSLCGELVEFAKAAAARGVFFAVSEDAGPGPRPHEGLEVLRARLQSEAAPGFRWRIDLDPEWPFFLAPVDACAALLDLFADYPYPNAAQAASLAAIEAHYDSAAAALGLSLEPPDLVLTLAGNGLLERGSYDEALKVLTRLTELYPSSMNGIWGLANLHRAMGDTATAIRYYEECLSRDANMTPAREWLRRLRGGSEHRPMLPR